MKRGLVCGGAGAAWAVVVLDAARVIPDDNWTISRVGIGLAVCLTVQLMLWARDKPQAEAFDLGVELGRREALREMNRKVTPLRPVPHGLTDFNASNRRRLNGHASIDA